MTVSGERQKPNIRISELQLCDLLVFIVVVLVIFRGFIDNFLGNGTAFVDIFFAALLPCCFFALLSGKVSRSSYGPVLRFYLFWMFFCVLLAAVQIGLGGTTLWDAALGLRDNNVYTLLFFVIALQMERRGALSLYRLFINCGTLICAFAIAQFAFRNVLPDSLLVLKGEDPFGFHGTDLIRVTGLMGNTIIFGGFAIVLFALVWAQTLNERFRSPASVVKLVVIAAANALTFSRASVVGMAMIAFVQFVLYGAAHKKFWEYLAVAFCAIVALGVIVVVFFWDSTIVQRLLGLNGIWNEGSDAEHFRMIREALSVIGRNWLVGTLMGNSTAVITDGVFWAYAVEWGIPVFLLYLILFGWLCAIAYRKNKSKDAFTATLANGFLGMALYMFCFSFINSAYGARSVLVFFWMTAGLMLASQNHFAVPAHGLSVRQEYTADRSGLQKEDKPMTRIPKIIHACWLGKGEMPADQKAYVEGWKRLHPDWEVIVWTDEMFAPYLHDSAFVREAIARRKYGFLSDYFRFTVLHAFGGVYIDTDVELFKPLDAFLGCKMFMGFIFDTALGTALIGSEKGNPLLMEWRDLLEKDFERKGDFTVSNDWITRYFLDRFPDFRLNGKRQSLACGIEVYPKDWFERYQIDKKSGGGYAEHHCAGSWKDGAEGGGKGFLKKLLPRGLVSWLGHKRIVRQSPYYKIYLEHRRK